MIRILVVFLVVLLTSCSDSESVQDPQPSVMDAGGTSTGEDVGGGDTASDVAPDDVGEEDDVSEGDATVSDVSADPETDSEIDTTPDVDEDGGSTGPLVLVLGGSVSGEVTGPDDEGGVNVTIDLVEGDVIRLVGQATSGDLQPAAYLHAPNGTFVEPDDFEVNNGSVSLNYTIQSTGVHEIRVRAYNGAGTGTFSLEGTCVAGPCLARLGEDGPVWLRIVAINDFHGHIEPPSGAVGGASWLTAHVRALRAESPNSIFVSAGDLLGASPYVSARFHDEPTIDVMNAAGLEINAVGNHEFDEGIGELRRLQNGGCHPVDGCEGPDGEFTGATFETLGANVVEAETGARAFPSFTLRTYEGVSVAFIGMTLEQTRSVTVPSRVEDLDFEDELETVRRVLPELRDLGIHAIVVVLHQGGTQNGDENDCRDLQGRIVAIAEAMDDEVDAILSGHTHDTYVCDINGIALTSAGSSGRWVTRLDMTLDRESGDVLTTSARNIRVDHEIPPDPVTEAIVSRYKTQVEAETNTVIGVLEGSLSSSADSSNGLSPLGLVIADSQLAATRESAGAQIAFMNQGGIRSSLPRGEITFGDAFEVQPFGNTLITFTLTGSQLLGVLRNQFAAFGFSVLQPSHTLTYRIEPVGNAWRLVEDSVQVDGEPLQEDASYRITSNRYLAEGGDRNAILAEGTDRQEGPIDVDAFVDYLADSPSPLPVPALDRVTQQ